MIFGSQGGLAGGTAPCRSVGGIQIIEEGKRVLFSFRKSSALIVSGLLLLQMFGTASAATPDPANPESAPQLVKFTPSAELSAQLAKARATRLAADALKGRQQQQLERTGTGFVPGDGAPSRATMYKGDDTVRVIVTMDGESAAEKVTASGKQIQSVGAAFVKDAAQSTVDARNSVMSAARSSGVTMSVRHTYGVALNGFSGEMRYGDIGKLQKVQGVKRVDVAQRYEPTDNFSTETVGASELWDRNPAVDGIGQVIAIIDTGVDYRHPDLGGQADLDPNGKVIGGWNFADDSSQVLDFSGSGHGTHVAGIAAATGEGPQHIKGMAPKAKILAQKVFSNDVDNPSAYTDDLVAAINDSIDPNSDHHYGVVADVLNMSLGAVSGFADANDPEQQAIAAAANAGAVVAISAGNSSYSTSAIFNPYYWNQDIAAVGSPGTAPEAITVASSQNSTVTIEGRGLVAKIDGEAYTGGNYTVYLDGSSPFGAFQTVGGQSLPLAIPSGDERGCSSADWEGVNLTGKVALIKRGTCTFQIKTDTVADAGAEAVVIFNQNPDPDLTAMAVDDATIPSVMVMNSYGTDLQAALEAGEEVKVAFNGQEQRLQLPDANGDTMSSFSSWGTTPELGFKPDLTAPGGNIFSTVPNGQYAINNGTSMAAPHVAGAAALIKQAHPDFTSAEVKAALMNTALVLKPLGDDFPYSPRQQGAGRIQVDNAIDTNVVVTAGDNQTPGLMLGAVASGSVTPFTLTLTNRGSAAATFDLSSEVYRPSFDESGNFNTLGSTELDGAYITLDGGITVPAGQTVTVDGALDLSDVTDPPTAMFGYFAEGFISLASTTDGQPDLTVPFMSFVGDWIGGDAAPIIDPMLDDDLSYLGTTGLYVPNLDYDEEDPDSEEWIGLGYDLDGTFHANDMAINNEWLGLLCECPEFEQGAWPALSLMRNAQILQIDVIDAENNLVERIGSEQLMRNLAAQPVYVGDDWHWDGLKYNRSTGEREPVPEGQYRVRVRALSPGGDADRDADWQTYMMPVKVDNTAPEFTVAEETGPTAPGPFTFNWTAAADNAGGSGLYGVVTILAGDVVSEQWSEPTASGSVTVDFAPVDYIGAGICLVDNAVNAQCYVLSDFDTNAIAADGELDIESNKPTVSLDFTIDETVQQVTYQVGAAEEVKVGATETINLNFAKDGKYTVVVRAYSDEEATTLVGSLTYTIDVDMTPPVLNITKPDIRTVYSSGRIDVAGSVTEAHPAESGVQWSLDDRGRWNDVEIDEDGSFAFRVNVVRDGRHNLKFQTSDAFGNHGELARVVIISRDGPQITTALDRIVQPGPGNIDVIVSQPGDFRLTGTTFALGSNYSFSINGMAQYTTDVVDPSVPRNWAYDVTEIGGADQAIISLEAWDPADFTTIRTVTFTPAGTPLVNAWVDVPVTTDPTVLVMGAVNPSVTAVSVNGVNAALSGGDFEAVVPLTPGKNPIEVLARTDDDTLLGLDLLTVIQDVGAPVIRITDPPNGAFINGPYTLEGTATDATLDTVTVDGFEVATNADGEFSYDWEPNGPDGEATIIVEATDMAGNTATATAAFNLDRTAPVLTVTAPSGLQTGTIRVAGTATDVNFASVTVNGVAATRDTDGKFTADLTFADGEQNITVSATDKAGNRTNWNGTVTIDSTPPAVTITSPAESAYLASGSVTVAGTVSDAHLATVTVDGQPVPLMDGSFSTTLSRTDGTYSVAVLATDTLGNTTTKSVSFSVVSTTPTITITSLHNGDVVGRTVTVSGDVVQANLAQLTVNGSNVTVAGGHFSTNVTFATDGQQTVTAVATDKAGHTDQKSVTVTSDGTAPQISITSPVDGSAGANPVTVTGTVSDANLDSVKVNGTAAQLGSNGAFTATVPVTDGKVKVVATDKAGNSAEKTISLVVSTVLKSLSLSPEGTWSPNGGKLKISYELAATGKVTLAVYGSDGKLKATLVRNSSKRKGLNTYEWTGKIGSKVIDGTYEVRLTAGAASLSRQTTIQSATLPAPTISTQPGTINSRTVAIEGTAAGAAKVTVTASGRSRVTPQTVTVGGDGTFVANFTLGSDGAYTFSAVAKDSLGNTSPADTVKLTLDTRGPSRPTITAPAYANGDQATLKVRASDTGTLTVSTAGMDDQTFVIKKTSSTVSLDLADLDEGKHTFTASFQDGIGNSATGTATFTIIVDGTQPDVVEITSAPTAPKGKSYTLTGKVTDTGGSGIATVTVNGSRASVKSDGTFVYRKTLSSRAGTVTKFVIVVTDKAGNRYTETFEVTGN